MSETTSSTAASADAPTAIQVVLSSHVDTPLLPSAAAVSGL
jgi:hypothetical protein